ncbi:MAG: GNAT family N-acetyltransferase [Patescibacteria group bacterium]|jgi:ribosomal protein S18 acetylase RimI-like enzyme
MITLSTAKKSESLEEEWKLFSKGKYGPTAHWLEKHFRFKAVEDGELVGTIEGKIEGDVVYIAALMVKPTVRGKGVGQMLVNRAELFGKKHKATKTWLLTGANWESNGFYQKMGFTKSATIPKLFFNVDFNAYIRIIKQ